MLNTLVAQRSGSVWILWLPPVKMSPKVCSGFGRSVSSRGSLSLLRWLRVKKDVLKANICCYVVSRMDEDGARMDPFGRGGDSCYTPLSYSKYWNVLREGHIQLSSRIPECWGLINHFQTNDGGLKCSCWGLLGITAMQSQNVSL